LASQKKSLEHVQQRTSVHQQHLLLMKMFDHLQQAKVFLQRHYLRQLFLQQLFLQQFFLQQPS